QSEPGNLIESTICLSPFASRFVLPVGLAAVCTSRNFVLHAVESWYPKIEPGDLIQLTSCLSPSASRFVFPTRNLILHAIKGWYPRIFGSRRYDIDRTQQHLVCSG